MDTLITSVGIVTDKPYDHKLNDVMELFNLSLSDLREMAIGDISGNLIVREGASTRDRDLIGHINRWRTGIDTSHMLECARAARDGHRPGVIVLAVGAAKAEIIRACCRLGLVSRLVLDRELADAIVRLPAEPASTAGPSDG